MYDSLTARVLVGALVEVSGRSQMATTDAQGRFRIDSLSAGPHRVSFSAIELDSIGLFGFARDVQVHANAIERVALATPSFRTMYSQLCAPPDTPQADSAIVFGTVYDAATGAPVDSAQVHFIWQGTSLVDRQVRLLDFSRDTRAGADGNYGVCGLPANAPLATQAINSRAASGRISTAVGNARIVRRDLYISDEMPAEGRAAPASGTGLVRGRISDSAGVPVADVNVRLPSVDSILQTDSLGQFVFTNAPLGTQQVEARMAGRRPAVAIVNVRRGEPADAEIVLLARAIASRTSPRPTGIDQRAYLEHKESGRGQFIDRQLIISQADIFAVLRLFGEIDVRSSSVGIEIASIRGRCAPIFAIDGKRTMLTDVAAFRDLPPHRIMALEYYDDTAAVPPEFARGARLPCGMMVIWTTAARW